MGYVGLNLAMALPDTFKVVGYDTNGFLVERLNEGISHIEGISNNSILRKIQKGIFKATDIAENISHSDIIVIAVPTPLDELKKPDLTYLESACQTIGENLKKKCLIINESTSFPGTLRDFIEPRITSLIQEDVSIEFAVSPERVDPGNATWNLYNTPRLVAGLSPSATSEAKKFYGSFCDAVHIVSCPEVAESAKLFENTFRQVNIALVNEFSQITNALDISVYEVLEAAATKPYGFMKFMPSAGVGGHCIPVDPSYLASKAAELGTPANFISLANKTNLEMSEYVAQRISQDHQFNLIGKKIQIVGVAYKPDVADTRETPAGRVIDALKSLGADVTWHDPLVKEWRGGKSEPLTKSDIIVIITMHTILSSISFDTFSPYVFDTTGSLPNAKKL